MSLAAGGLAAAFSIRVEDFSLLSAHQTKRALSLPNDPLTMLREKKCTLGNLDFSLPIFEAHSHLAQDFFG